MFISSHVPGSKIQFLVIGDLLEYIMHSSSLRSIGWILTKIILDIYINNGKEIKIVGRRDYVLVLSITMTLVCKKSSNKSSNTDDFLRRTT
jgi:hypothetical protein